MKKSFLKLLLCVTAAVIQLGLSSGDIAPPFSAKNQDGKLVESTALRGSYILLYFYPKDDTPGCTREACSFRDNYAQLKKLNVSIYGVSTQDADSHQKFRQKHRLPFDLLVDSEGTLAKSMGVGSMKIIGLHQRQSILISPEGKVVKFYDDVDPKTHVDEVIRDVTSWSKKAK